jgi:hypothetical protein
MFDKVKASGLGAAIGASLATVVVWLLDTYVLVGLMPDNVHGALEMLIAALVYAAISAAGALIAGFKQPERKGYINTNAVRR